MAPDARLFLTAWLLTLLGWVVLLAGGVVINVLITDRIDSFLGERLVTVATLIVAIKLGVMLYDHAFSRVVPDRPLRAEASKIGAHAEE